jgi:hypothetical protein
LKVHLHHFSSVADPDPGSGIGVFLTPGSGIRNKHPGSATLHFSMIKIKKKARFFLLFLLGDRKSQIRIQEAQKHTDPTDPDSDPQHWLLEILDPFSFAF